jgi:dolichol kinase
MHYAVVMLVAVLAFFTTGSPGKAFAPAAMLILGSLAGGDGLADIIGRRYGGKSFGIGGSTKTLAGSLAMFVGSFAMSWLLLAAFGWRSGQGSAALVMPALALSLLATVVEAFSPQGFDNYTIPLAVLAGAWGMGLL